MCLPLPPCFLGSEGSVEGYHVPFETGVLWGLRLLWGLPLHILTNTSEGGDSECEVTKWHKCHGSRLMVSEQQVDGTGNW